MSDGKASEPGQLRLGLAAAGNLRWAVVDVTRPLEHVRRRLDLSPIAAVALGRLLSGAALMLRFTTKNPGMLALEVLGDGPLGKLSASIDDLGRMRGLVGEPRVETPADGRLAVGWAVGKGTLQVTRDSQRGRYTSQVALVNGEIGTDLTHFLEQSEQIHSAALVGVLPRIDGIAAAGGLLIEALPGTEEDIISHLENNIDDLREDRPAGTQRGVSHYLELGGVEALLDTVLMGFDREELESHEVRYRCRCSRAYIREKLLGLPTEDLSSVIDENGLCEVSCSFCGERYLLTSRELLPQ